MVIQKRDKRGPGLTSCDVQLKAVHEIGSGTFGRVFKTVIGGVSYAVKKFTFSSDDLLHVTTLREIKALRAVQSQYVLKIDQIIVNSYVIHLLFPYYEFDLYRLIGSVNFTLQDIRHIFRQVLKGVEDIHNSGYLHRDLKSANILLNRVGAGKDESGESEDVGPKRVRHEKTGEAGEYVYEACICDFGMSRKQCREMSPGVVTLWYRAPELLLGSFSYSKSIDVWSLGCVLLEFFNRKPIFKGNTEVEVLCMITELCGSINEESFPGCTKLPLFSKFNLGEGKRKIAETFSLHNEDAIDLAERMLRLDPNERITIEQCLAHPFLLP